MGITGTLGGPRKAPLATLAADDVVVVIVVDDSGLGIMFRLEGQKRRDSEQTCVEGGDEYGFARDEADEKAVGPTYFLSAALCSGIRAGQRGLRPYCK